MEKGLIAISENLGLTPRDLEVLRLVALGYTNKEIAEKMYFSPKTVEHLLSVEDPDRGIFHKIGVRNRTQAAAWYAEIQTGYRFLEHYDHYLKSIRRIRIQGNPYEALEWATRMADQLNGEITLGANRPKYFKSLLRRLASALFEQILAKNEITSLQTIGLFAMPIVKQIEKIAEECQDEEIFGIAHYSMGMVYHIQQQHLAAIAEFNMASDTSRNSNRQLNLLRTKALGWAFLGDEPKFTKVENQVIELINRDNSAELHAICMAFEGLGRGQGQLNQLTAFETLKTGWDIYTKMMDANNKVPIRKVQISRSEFEIACNLIPDDQRLIESLGQKALDAAHELGYLRYEEQIKMHLEMHLN
jgi:DNA-binding CsgD family transcriptional regulator